MRVVVDGFWLTATLLSFDENRVFEDKIELALQLFFISGTDDSGPGFL